MKLLALLHIEISTIFIYISLLVLSFFVLMISLVFWSEKRQLRNIRVKELKMPADRGVVEKWIDIKTLFFFPTFMQWTEEICDYNLKVFKMLNENEIYYERTDEMIEKINETKRALKMGYKSVGMKKLSFEFGKELDKAIMYSKQLWNDINNTKP